MMIRRIAAFFALVSGLCHASTFMETCGPAAFEGNSGAIAFITVSFALVALAIGIAYMYSKAREDAHVGVWAKDEAQNLLISVLLFAGLAVFFMGACSIAESYSGADPFYVSKTYINNLLSSNGRSLLYSLTSGSLNDQKEATSYLYVGMTPVFGSGVSKQASHRAYSAHKEFIIDTYIPIMASLTAQRYLLEAIQWIGASVLLPFAFIMRLIPPTREFGNTLIALFFGLYIVAPAMYAMSANAFRDIASTPTCVDCGVHNFHSYSLDADGVAWEKALLYRVGSTIPQAVFLPNIVIIVVVTCTMSISKALKALAV